MDKIKALLRGLGIALLPLLKPLLKSAAVRIVESEGDRLQEKLKERVGERGPQEIDRVIDKAEAALKARLLNLPFLPESVREELNRILTEHAGRLRSRLKDELASRGLPGIDLACDAAQRLLIAQIEAL